MKLHESYFEELNEYLVVQAKTEHIAQNTGCSEEDARKATLEQLEEDAIKFVEDACRVHESTGLRKSQENAHHCLVLRSEEA